MTGNNPSTLAEGVVDKPINDLPRASTLLSEDLLVLQQANEAKAISAETLMRDLLDAIGANGGITNIRLVASNGLIDTYVIDTASGETFQYSLRNGAGISGVTKVGTNGLQDRYQISLENGTNQYFVVTNGNGITSFAHVATSGLEKTYRITMKDGNGFDMVVRDGAPGAKGDNTYMHIKWAAQQPNAEHSTISDVPDKWMGVYWGPSAQAPTDYTQYQWQYTQGLPGETGPYPTMTVDRFESIKGVQLFVLNPDNTSFTAYVYDGPQGDPGNSPYVGYNGNWWVGEEDTGIPATGTADGVIANMSVMQFSDTTLFSSATSDKSASELISAMNAGKPVYFKETLSGTLYVPVFTLGGDVYFHFWAGENLKTHCIGRLNGTNVTVTAIADGEQMEYIDLNALGVPVHTIGGGEFTSAQVGAETVAEILAKAEETGMLGFRFNVAFLGTTLPITVSGGYVSGMGGYQVHANVWYGGTVTLLTVEIGATNITIYDTAMATSSLDEDQVVALIRQELGVIENGTY